MYIPKPFEAPDIRVMHDLIRAYPLATLVTSSQNALNANHIPVHPTETPKPYGSLRGHISRANPLISELTEVNESLAVFHGPNAYISPSRYASKKEHGKVVPTWNYATVHAYGVIRVVDDADWLLDQLEALTDSNEASFPEPWAVADAPADFTEKLMESIMGIEMTITKLIGKWKISQNQPRQNRDGVIAGLTARNSSGTSAMAELIKQDIRKEKEK